MKNVNDKKLCWWCLVSHQEGNRKIVKKPDRKIVKKPDRKIVKKPHRKIVKLFPNKFEGSWPHSKIVKKVQSHTGKLSKTSEMIFTEKISICRPCQQSKMKKKLLLCSQPYWKIVKKLHSHKYRKIVELMCRLMAIQENCQTII